MKKSQSFTGMIPGDGPVLVLINLQLEEDVGTAHEQAQCLGKVWPNVPKRDYVRYRLVFDNR